MTKVRIMFWINWRQRLKFEGPTLPEPSMTKPRSSFVLQTEKRKTRRKKMVSITLGHGTKLDDSVIRKQYGNVKVFVSVSFQ